MVGVRCSLSFLQCCDTVGCSTEKLWWINKTVCVCVYALILSDGPKQISEQEPNDSLKWLQDNWYDEQSVDCSLQTNSGPKMSHRQENNTVGWMLGSAASQKRFSSNISLSRSMEDWTKSAKQRAKENIAASFRMSAYNWRNVLKTSLI